MAGVLPPGDKEHTMLAERHEDIVYIETPTELAPGPHGLLRKVRRSGIELAAHGPGELLEIRLDHGSASVITVIHLFGVNHHRLPRPAAALDDSGSRLEIKQPLPVIRHQHQIHGRQQSLHPLQEVLPQLRSQASLLLAIHPQQVMTARHIARLDRRGQPRGSQQLRLGPHALQEIQQLLPLRILTRHAQEVHRAPETAQIAHHVTRAARHPLLAPEEHHGHRCLRRQAGRLAVHKHIQHHIPDAQQARSGKAVHNRPEVRSSHICFLF